MTYIDPPNIDLTSCIAYYIFLSFFLHAISLVPKPSLC
ncbi:unnamed protein product, partial [marine sediment metagenome]